MIDEAPRTGAPIGAPAGTAPGSRRSTVIVSTVPSDSHTWNLVFLELLIEELGYDVVNLGPCVPEETLIDACVLHEPVFVVISSVNGHGYRDGLHLITRLRSRPDLADLPAVIGGKLGTDDAGAERRAADLTAAGFDAVFQDGSQAVASFRRFVDAVERRVLP